MAKERNEIKIRMIKIIRIVYTSRVYGTEISILYGEVSRVNALSDYKIMGGNTWHIMGWQKG